MRDARAGRHGHGPRRSRQDLAARRDPRDEGRRARSRRHHAAHRRLSRGRRRRPQRGLPRHAGSRGVHPDARPRRQGHRRRRARRGGRRRRHAADAGSDRPREGGQRADRGGDQQDRQAGRQPGQRQARAGRAEPGAGRLGRPDRHGAGVGQEEAEPRSAARDDPAVDRHPRAQGQPEAQRLRRGARSRSSIAAAVRWRRCSSRTARSASATTSSPARWSAGCSALIDDRGRPVEVGGAGHAGRSAWD